MKYQNSILLERIAVLEKDENQSMFETCFPRPQAHCSSKTNQDPVKRCPTAHSCTAHRCCSSPVLLCCQASACHCYGSNPPPNTALSGIEKKIVTLDINLQQVRKDNDKTIQPASDNIDIVELHTDVDHVQAHGLQSKSTNISEEYFEFESLMLPEDCDQVANDSSMNTIDENMEEIPFDLPLNSSDLTTQLPILRH